MSFFSHNPEKWDEIEANAVLTKLGWEHDEDSRNLLLELATVFPDAWRLILSKVDLAAAEQDFWGDMADAYLAGAE